MDLAELLERPLLDWLPEKVLNTWREYEYYHDTEDKAAKWQSYSAS